MDKEKLKLIKEALPSKYAKLIKEKTGLSSSSIFRTFNENDELVVEEVVDAALEIIQETKQKQIDRDKKMSELL